MSINAIDEKRGLAVLRHLEVAELGGRRAAGERVKRGGVEGLDGFGDGKSVGGEPAHREFAAIAENVHDGIGIVLVRELHVRDIPREAGDASGYDRFRPRVARNVDGDDLRGVGRPGAFAAVDEFLAIHRVHGDVADARQGCLEVFDKDQPSVRLVVCPLGDLSTVAPVVLRRVDAGRIRREVESVGLHSVRGRKRKEPDALHPLPVARGQGARLGG